MLDEHLPFIGREDAGNFCFARLCLDPLSAGKDDGFAKRPTLEILAKKRLDGMRPVLDLGTVDKVVHPTQEVGADSDCNTGTIHFDALKIRGYESFS
jgi:hypothetical protein